MFMTVNVLLTHKWTLCCTVISLTAYILRRMHTWIRNGSYTNHLNNSVYLKRSHELFQRWKIVKILRFKLQQETGLLGRALLLFKVTLLGIVGQDFLLLLIVTQLNLCHVKLFREIYRNKFWMHLIFSLHHQFSLLFASSVFLSAIFFSLFFLRRFVMLIYITSLH